VQADEQLALLQRYQAEATALGARLQEATARAGRPGRRSARWFGGGATPPAGEIDGDPLRRAAALLSEIGAWLGRAFPELTALIQAHSHQSTLLALPQELNESEDLTKPLGRVMDDVIGWLGAERGFLLLLDAAGSRLEVVIACDGHRRGISRDAYQLSWSVINRVAQTHEPVLTDNAEGDARFSAATSVLEFSLRSILCVPLLVADRLIGVVYLDNHAVKGRFSEADLEVLRLFANQSAATIESAQLFNSLREANSRMRLIFDSVASGVLTTDSEGKIAIFNPAAEKIFGFTAQEAQGTLYRLPLAMENQTMLIEDMERALRDGAQIAGQEVVGVLPRRGEAYLDYSLSPLRSANGEITGSALVVHDLTETKRLVAEQEKEKQRFEDVLELVVPIAAALSAESDLDGLLDRLVVEAMLLTQADGGTIYMVDGRHLRFAIVRNSSLHIVRGGTTSFEVPYPLLPLYDQTTGAPNHRHIASYTALRRQPVNLPDAYDSEDFDFSGTRAFDAALGYRTVSVLTSPLLDSRGQVIGVLELINAKDVRTGAIVPFDPRLVRTVDILSRLAGLVLQASLREQGLRREIEELRIEVDEVKKAHAVAEITGTEYFEHLQTRAREMRTRRAHPGKPA
jgi:PAS domain S-box-containing protein